MNLIEKYYSHLAGLTDNCEFEMKHIDGKTGQFNYVVVASKTDKINMVNNGYITRLLENYLLERGMKTRLCNPDKELKKSIGKMNYEYYTVLAYKKQDKKEFAEKFLGLIGRLSVNKMCVFKEEVEKSVINVVEAARNSYSVYNNQPWRLVAYNDRIHMFCKNENDFLEKQMYETKMRDIGRALADMEETAEEEWLMTKYLVSSKVAGKSVKDHEYVITMILKRTV